MGGLRGGAPQSPEATPPELIFLAVLTFFKRVSTVSSKNAAVHSPPSARPLLLPSAAQLLACMLLLPSAPLLLALPLHGWRVELAPSASTTTLPASTLTTFCVAVSARSAA